MSTTHGPGSHPAPEPDLVGLLRGELSNAETTAAGEHLRGCDTCRQDLVDAAVGHGLLARAVDVLGLDVPVPAAPAPVVAADEHAETPRGRAVGPGRRRLALVAAAVLVAAGASSATWAVTGRDDAAVPSAGSSPTAVPTPTTAPTVPAATAALVPVQPALDPGGAGRVQMVAEGGGHTTMTIQVTGLPTPDDDSYYYAWLLDPGTQKMLPLGQVGPGGSASFDLDDVLVTAYSAIDISLEHDDGDPAHSVTSVLRGGYDPESVES